VNPTPKRASDQAVYHQQFVKALPIEPFLVKRQRWRLRVNNAGLVECDGDYLAAGNSVHSDLGELRLTQGFTLYLLDSSSGIRRDPGQPLVVTTYLSLVTLSRLVLWLR
jgi:hypothetical protein